MPDASIDPRYRSVQVGLVYSQLSFGSLGGIAGTLFVVFFVGEHFPWIVPALWIASVVFFVGVIPNVLSWLFRRAQPEDRERLVWARRLIVSSALAGGAWGAAGVVMYVPGDLLSQFLVMFLLFMGASAIMAMTAPYSPSFFAAVGLSLAPIGMRCAIDGDAAHLGMAAMVPVFFGVLLAIQRNTHKAILKSITLRFENVVLLHEANRRRRESEQASKAKSRFLAAASHDLRQPLHAQGLLLEELKERELDRDTRRLLDSVTSCTESLRSLLDALLDISRLDAGTVESQPGVFPVQRILDQLQGEFAPRADARGLRLDVVPCSAVVFSDEVLLARVLRNLLDNAISYTNSGRILAGCRRRGDRLLIQVCDTGIGIDKTELENIFVEFYQLGNPERDRRKGLGIGLAIVERVCRLLDCGFRVESIPGRGSVFSVQVPLVAQKALPDHPGAAAALLNEDVNGTTVLIIEDEREVRESTRSLLESWGCSVLEASDERSAIEVVQRAPQPPDVVIADYRLRQGATGIDAINAVRDRLGRDVPGLLVSGDTHPNRLREARASGYTLVHKPAPAHKLRSFISWQRASRKGSTAVVEGR